MGLRTYALSAVFCVLVAPAALAAPKLKLAPVELTGYVGKDLKISFSLPCGANFHGIVTSTNKKNLRVGVAYLMSAIRCASVPERQEMVIRYLDTTGFKEISPLKIKQNRMKIISDRMLDVRILPRRKGQQKIQVAYEPSCGSAVGTLIQQIGPNALNVSQLEKMSVRQSTSSCPRAQHQATITSIKVSPKLVIGLIGSSSRGKQRLYSLKLAKIKKKSLHRLKRRGISLRYLRSCNDAPVGVVLKGRGKKKSEIGMLVAHYYNRKCSDKATWTKYINRSIFLSKSKPLVSLKSAIKAANLRVVSPTSFSRMGARRQAKTGVSIDYLNGCSPVLGAVYAQNPSIRGVHIGILVDQRDNSCKKSLAEVSLFEPFLSKNIRLGSLHPLRIKGKVSH